MKQINYSEDIRIDESSLDVEWLDQPVKMLEYSRHAAEMRREMDRAKDALDLSKAELDRKIRTRPEKFGLEKVTEGAVVNAIIAHEDYQNALSDYNDARYENEVAQGAVRAFEQRKSALENLVKLFGQQYFAGPTLPRDLSNERLEIERNKRSDAGVAGKMKRIKKDEKE